MSALQNGLSVLDMFSRPGQIVTVGEIAEELDIHKSTASRLAATLTMGGYLRSGRGGRGYELGARIARLGQLTAGDVDVAEVATPHLRALAEEVGETCHLGILDGPDAVTIAVAEGPHSMRMHAQVGKRSPAYLTAMGKSLLAFDDPAAVRERFGEREFQHPTAHAVRDVTDLLAQLGVVRDRGYAIDDEELEIGLRCVAAPIVGVSGAVVGSVTASCAASRVSREQIHWLAPRVIACAATINAEIGAPREPATAS